ncbi:delta 4, 5-alpha steroid dehydrogenase [Cupriavidus necator]|uniref:Delta 4, 5-alpha steroid dehydrogenase n=1 Tax=Cupriavidus necator TaxID=106590 RepID=A0A1U9V0E9_CUPNE|nr:FAD-binding protein [Cupriavidus necator]AQV98289.1 delta 4, 5-alpha steroid dehydrogenase [Cupriavidus necator]
MTPRRAAGGGHTNTPVAPPLVVSDAGEVAWSESADVVVVGWGAAGACAAIEARESSGGAASVIVIDRFEGGGASALSGGVVYAGGGTPYQREAGYDDTPEAMFDYLCREVNGVVADATLARFCRDSASNLAWLERHGARYGATMPATKTSYPPDGAYLYYSGNEVVPAYRGAHPPAPRGHRTVARGQAGATLYAALRAATLRAGAQPLLQATVRRLVQRRTDGCVLGVEVWQLPAGHPDTERHARLNRLANRWRNYRAGKAEQWRREAADIERRLARPRFVRARSGVILSAGGFVFNRDMVRQHAPAYARGWKNGHAGCDGSGILLGQGAGGQTAQMDNVSAWRFLTPPSAWPKGMVVNARGERFCNEQVYGATLGHEMVAHQGGKAWLILDARLRRQALRECLFGGLWAFQALPALAMMLLGAKKASSIDALADRIGADRATLARTWAASDAAARGSCEDPLGKSEDMRQVLDRPPFYALDISMGSPALPLATITLGGLRVNEDDGHVRDADGNDIPGLYAAGRTAIGIPSSRYMSGTSLADCVFSGRRAGRAAVAGEWSPAARPGEAVAVAGER